PSTRSPFCAPIASVISASRNSSITVRTIGRRKSPSSAIIALISLVVLLLFFRVMVRYSVGSYLLPTAYHDLSLIAEPSGRYLRDGGGAVATLPSFVAGARRVAGGSICRRNRLALFFFLTAIPGAGNGGGC